MAEYSQLWRKKLRIRRMIKFAEKELGGEDYGEKDIERIRDKLDSEMKTRWRLVSSTRKDYLERVERILRKEYVLNV